MWLNDVDHSQDAFSAKRGNLASHENHGIVMETWIKTKIQIRRYFEAGQSKISRINPMALAKEPSSMVLLVVLKSKALRICLSMMRNYQFRHLMLLTNLQMTFAKMHL